MAHLTWTKLGSGGSEYWVRESAVNPIGKEEPRESKQSWLRKAAPRTMQTWLPGWRPRERMLAVLTVLWKRQQQPVQPGLAKNSPGLHLCQSGLGTLSRTEEIKFHYYKHS